MKITAIEKQRHNEKRYSIFIDGEFAFGLEEVDLLYYKLLESEEISEEKYNYITENAVLGKAKNTAIRFLGFKARTKKEIIGKLEENDYSEHIIQSVVEFLERYNYINDREYAGSFLRDKFNLKGFGKKRIAYELRLKGISQQIIHEVLEENEVDEVGRAVELVERKYGDCSELEFKEKRKVIGFLQRKGFNFDIIKEVFERLEDGGGY